MAFKFNVGTYKVGGQLDIDDINLTDATSVALKPDSITLDSMVDLSANKILGSAGGGTVSELDCTAAGRALLDDADAAAQRTTLGLAIGSDVQAHDAELAAIAGLTSAANKGIQFTGSGTAGVYDLTAAGKALLDDADAAAQRTTLGLVIGTNVQAQDAELAAIAGLTSAANKVPMFSGSGTATMIDFKDEDNMSSNSATAVPSQQSVKAYVDSVAQGLDIKESVVAASLEVFVVASACTSNTIVIANGEGGSNAANQFDSAANTFKMENISLSQGDRVLIKNGVNANGAGAHDKFNGIYTVGALDQATLTLTRAADFDTVGAAPDGNISSGAFVFVEQGSTSGDAGFVMTQDSAITVGTTAITWTQFSGAGQIAGADGIAITGNDVAVDLATNPALEFDSNKLRVKINGAGFLTRDSNGLSVNLGEGLENDSNNIRAKLDGGSLSRGASGLSITAAQSVISSLTNAALVLARDGDTRIDFGTTDKVIRFDAGAVDNIVTIDASTATQEFVKFNCGVVNKITSLTAASALTLKKEHNIIFLDATSNNVEVDLPAASGNAGLTYMFKRIDTSGNTAVIDPNLSEVIDGESGGAALSLEPFSAVTLVCDGAKWFIF